MKPKTKKISPHLIFLFVAVITAIYPHWILFSDDFQPRLLKEVPVILYYLALVFYGLTVLAIASFFRVSRGSWRFANAYLVSLGILVTVVVCIFSVLSSAPVVAIALSSIVFGVIALSLADTD